MEENPVAWRLTAREREVAALIGLGLTNRQIAVKLSISERTVGAHVQNILNKLGASNRAQIATWSAHASMQLRHPPVVVQRPSPDSVSAVSNAAAKRAASSRQGVSRAMGLLVALALVIAATDDIPRPAGVDGALPVNVGALAYEATLAGDGVGFGARYVVGDPSASEIRFLNGAVEFAVVKPGGDTGSRVAMEPLRRYYIEVQLSVAPGSNVEFWFNLGSNGFFTHVGDHLVDLQTAAELIQLQYFVQNQGGQPLGPQIEIKGLQSGRSFHLGVLVDPPHYQVYLDGRSVISLHHAPSAALQAPSFAIFGDGDGTGTVRLTAMRAYRLS